MFPSIRGIVALAIVASGSATAQSHSPPNVGLFNLTGINPPSTATLVSVFLGYGTQNYTCNSTTNEYSDGPLSEAKLLDVTSSFTGNSMTEYPPIAELRVVGTHFWVPNPVASDPPLVERWQNNDASRYFVGEKFETAPSTEPSFSVVSVFLQHLGGTWADYVVRTNTEGGVPPSVFNPCTPGNTIAIPYSANYLFFKNPGTNSSSAADPTMTQTPTSGATKVKSSLQIILPGVLVGFIFLL